MEKKDITIVCKDCAEDFLFTVGEQEFYEEKGFTNSPVRCKECRMKKRDNRNFNSDRRDA